VMRWSRLRSLVEGLFVPGLNLRLHCTGIRDDVRRDPGAAVSRGVFQLWLGREVMWDFPAGFPDDGEGYSASDLSALLRDYLETAKDELLSREFPDDRHGLVDFLRLADRRIGGNTGGCNSRRSVSPWPRCSCSPP
jgi:hypothetical protein